MAVSRVLVVIRVDVIGIACARRLGSGRHVVLGDFPNNRLDQASKRLEAEGYRVTPVGINFIDPQSVNNLAVTADRLGQMDMVVHAGDANFANNPAGTKVMLDYNLMGTAIIIDRFSAIATPGMSVVCIASKAAKFCTADAQLEHHLATALIRLLLNHPYIQSVHGFEAYALAQRGKQLRVEAAAASYGERGARINTVSPGIIILYPMIQGGRMHSSMSREEFNLH